MNKRIAAIFLSFVFTLSLIPANVYANEASDNAITTTTDAVEGGGATDSTQNTPHPTGGGVTYPKKKF